MKLLIARPWRSQQPPSHALARSIDRVLRTRHVSTVTVEEAGRTARPRSQLVALMSHAIAMRRGLHVERLPRDTLAASFLPYDGTALLPLLRTLTMTFEPLSRYRFHRVPNAEHTAILIAAGLAIRSAQHLT